MFLICLFHQALLRSHSRFVSFALSLLPLCSSFRLCFLPWDKFPDIPLLNPTCFHVGLFGSSVLHILIIFFSFFVFPSLFVLLVGFCVVFFWLLFSPFFSFLVFLFFVFLCWVCFVFVVSVVLVSDSDKRKKYFSCSGAFWGEGSAKPLLVRMFC